jgi:hypothetical protein
MRSEYDNCTSYLLSFRKNLRDAHHNSQHTPESAEEMMVLGGGFNPKILSVGATKTP